MSDVQNPIVGYRRVTDGQESRIRSERNGAMVVQTLHAPYAEEAIRGNTWTVSTPVAGITVTALMLVSVASAIPIVGIYNPTGSGKNLVIHRALAVQTTGTVCNFVWGAVAAPAMTTANGLTTHINNFTLAAGSAAGSVARSFAGATAMVGTATTFRIFPGAAVEGASAAGTNISPQVDEVAGEVVVAPGNLVGVFGATVTTAGVARATLVWSEVDA